MKGSNIYSLILLVVAIWCQPYQAKTMPEKEKDTTNRLVYLTFDLDIGLTSLHSSLRDKYEGPRYDENKFTTKPPEWKWIDRDTTTTDLLDAYKLRSYKLNTSLIIWDNVNFGVTYHVFFLLNRNNGTLASSIPNFAIGGLLGYDYSPDILKGVFIHPSISFGGYQSNNYYEGVGQEWYLNGKVAIGYRLNNNVGARLFVSNNLFLYRNKEESEQFNRTSTTEVDLSMLQFGAGLTYRFTINPK